MPKFENESEKPVQEESLYVPGAHRKEESSPKEGSNLRSRWKRPRGNEPAVRQENIRQESGKQVEANLPRGESQQNKPMRVEGMGKPRDEYSRRREHERSSESSQKSSRPFEHKRRDYHKEWKPTSSVTTKEVSLYQKLKGQIIKLLGLVDKEPKHSDGEESRRTSSNKRFSSYGSRSERQRGGERRYRHRHHRGGQSRYSQKEKNRED